MSEIECRHLPLSASPSKNKQGKARCGTQEADLVRAILRRGGGMVSKIQTAMALGLGTLALVTAFEVHAESGPATSTDSERSASKEAQDNETNKGVRAAELSEVIVTGSRLVLDGAAAPSPTTVLSANELERRAPTN